METVGELKKFLEKLDDNMPLVKKSDNFELRGAIIEGNYYPRVAKFRTEKRWFRDAFDYIDYAIEVYIEDDNGTECLLV